MRFLSQNRRLEIIRIRLLHSRDRCVCSFCLLTLDRISPCAPSAFYEWIHSSRLDSDTDIAFILADYVYDEELRILLRWSAQDRKTILLAERVSTCQRQRGVESKPSKLASIQIPLVIRRTRGEIHYWVFGQEGIIADTNRQLWPCAGTQLPNATK